MPKVFNPELHLQPPPGCSGQAGPSTLGNWCKSGPVNIRDPKETVFAATYRAVDLSKTYVVGK